MNANDNVGVYSWDCLYAQAAVNNRGLECHCGIDKGALTFHATTSVWIRLVMKRASLWPGSKKTNESGFSSVNECHFLVGVLMSAGSWCAIKSSLSCRVDTCRAFQTLEVCEGADAPLGLLTHFIGRHPSVVTHVVLWRGPRTWQLHMEVRLGYCTMLFVVVTSRGSVEGGARPGKVG